MNKVIGGIFTFIVLVFLIIMLILCTVKVPAGYVAVQYDMNGGIKDEVLTQGWHVIAPTTHTTRYTVGIEQSYLTAGENGDSKNDESFTASSSEGKDIRIDLTFTYQYNIDSVAKVFTQFKGQSGKEVRDTFIKPNIISWTKEVVAKYKVADILGSQRENINKALTEYLSGKFETYGITISNVSLINLEVDSKTAEAINAKIEAQQKAETQAINNQANIDKAEAEAQVKKTQAQAEAEAMMIKAQAEADALLIQSQAEAEANRQIAESLDKNLLDKMYFDAWDGKLPTMVTGDSSVLLSPVK